MHSNKLLIFLIFTDGKSNQTMCSFLKYLSQNERCSNNCICDNMYELK